MDDAKSIDVLDERLAKLDKTLDQDLKKNVLGKANGLRFMVLSSVVDGRYPEAIDELRLYEDINTLPVFRQQSSRYFSHCEELIRAIDSKKKFATSRSITRTQKQELHTMVRKHFQALSESLRQIETIENNIKVKDLRSTVWMLKSGTISVTVLLCSAMALEAYTHIWSPIRTIVNSSIQWVVQILFRIQ